jgi:hypothetical protein
MFTKRHYEAIAELLHTEYNDIREGKVIVTDPQSRLYEIGVITDKFTYLFTEDNEWFNRQMFEKRVFAFRIREDEVV